jgi:hypothetical protein
VVSSTVIASGQAVQDQANRHAGTFSIWRTDPKFLSSASPDLKKWFDDGEHLK